MCKTGLKKCLKLKKRYDDFPSDSVRLEKRNKTTTKVVIG